MDIRCIYRARSALSESALWSPEEKVLDRLDQMRPELHRLDPATGEDRKIEIELPAQLGGLVPRAGGGLALAASDGISLLGPDLQSRRSLTNPIAALPQASFNDAKCDRQGRLWAGTTDRMRLRRSAASTGSIPTAERRLLPTASSAPTARPSAPTGGSCTTPGPMSGSSRSTTSIRRRGGLSIPGSSPPSSPRPGCRTAPRWMPRAISGRPIGAAGESPAMRRTGAWIAWSKCRSEPYQLRLRRRGHGNPLRHQRVDRVRERPLGLYG